MITYVNTVLVSNRTDGAILTQAPAKANTMASVSTDAGKFILMNCDPLEQDPNNPDNDLIYKVTADNIQDIKTIKIGIVTKKNTAVRLPDGTTEFRPVIKWSNEIKKHDVKSLSFLSYEPDTEDSIEIDFTNLAQDVLDKFAEGGKRIIVRLTYKDMPHRYRKWTESYEYVTVTGDTKNSIATAIANMINREWKRARVNAAANGAKVTLTALPYDDDDAIETLNWANKVRFNANVYWTNPAGDGWESLNKYFPMGTMIQKVPGKTYPASAKLVRDRESQAMGYLGILNRGNGTWPIIKPEMETKLDGQYDAITLEFENMYRAADDIFRKTKQTVEIYGTTEKLGDLLEILNVFAHSAAIEDDREAATRQAADATLNDSINAERTARQNADNAFTNQINAINERLNAAGI